MSRGQGGLVPDAMGVVMHLQRLARTYGGLLAIAGFTSLMMAGVAYGQVAPGTRTDAFGNTITGSPVNSRIPTGLFRDISGVAPQFIMTPNSDDGESGLMPLGFMFPFYGRSYTGLNFTTNGMIATTAGGGEARDFSNDASLPTVPSIGGGARIYPHHDDLEAVVYGAYFSAAASGFGTEAFIAQWNACHFGCTPGSDLTVQFNVALLRDGTIIMAHQLVAGDGSSTPGEEATVGIQNEETADTTTTDDDDGVAYSADTANSIVDGMTVVVIPKDSGISDDVQIAATEAAVATTSAVAGNVHRHAALALRRKQPVARPATDERSDRNRNLWGSVIGGRSDGDVGSDLTVRNYGVQFGADLMKFGKAIFGISGAYQKADVALGHVNLEAKSGAIAPYLGVRFGNITASATIGYAHVDYSSFDLVFLRDIHTDSGKRIFGSAAVTASFDLGNVTLAPTITASAAREKIDQWQSGTISRDVEDARFFKFSAVTRAIVPVGVGTHVYLLGGVEYIKTKGDDTIALYATDYDPTRTGGVVGAGLSVDYGNLSFSADADASGLGSGMTSYNGKLRASLKF